MKMEQQDFSSYSIQYPVRNSYLHYRLRKTAKKADIWINCACGRRFKLKDEESILTCPHCKKKIEDTEIVEVDNRKITTYNYGTTLFIDEDVLTISLFMTRVSQIPNIVPLQHEKGSFFLRIRFDKTKRTAVMYTTGFKNLDRDSTYGVDRYGKFINFTQPTFDPFYNFNIKLHPDLINEFCNFYKIKVPKEKLDLLDLAWINRVGKHSRKHLKERYILSRTKEDKLMTTESIKSELRDLIKDVPLEVRMKHQKEYNELYSMHSISFSYHNIRDIQKACAKLHEIIKDSGYIIISNKLNSLNKIIKDSKLQWKSIGRINRFLANNHKIRNYDELLFESICNFHNEKMDGISIKIREAFINSPWAITQKDNLITLFTNEDILIKVIRNSNFPKDEFIRRPEHRIVREDVLKAFSLKAREEGVERLTHSDIIKIEKQLQSILNKHKTLDRGISTIVKFIGLAKVAIDKEINFKQRKDIEKMKDEIDRNTIIAGLNNGEIKNREYTTSINHEKAIIGKKEYTIIPLKNRYDVIISQLKTRSIRENIFIGEKYSHNDIGAFEIRSGNTSLATIMIVKYYNKMSLTLLSDEDTNVDIQNIIINIANRYKFEIVDSHIFYRSQSKMKKVNILAA